VKCDGFFWHGGFVALVFELFDGVKFFLVGEGVQCGVDEEVNEFFAELCECLLGVDIFGVISNRCVCDDVKGFRGDVEGFEFFGEVFEVVKGLELLL